jgi:protein-disulfide isomerase
MSSNSNESKHVTLWTLLDRLTTIVTLLATATALVVLFSAGRTVPEATARERQIQQPVEDVPDLAIGMTGNIKGDGTARVVLVEFGDFECPYCARHASETHPQIEREFVESGQIRYAFRHLPLPIHPSAFGAAIAAECAGRQGKFWDMKAALFSNAQASNGESLSPDSLLQRAEDSALQMQGFSECVNGRQAAKQIQLDRREAARLEIKSTPTFFVGQIQSDGKTILLKKRINGAQSFRTFRGILLWALDRWA